MNLQEKTDELKCDKIDSCARYEHILSGQKEYCHSEKYLDCCHWNKAGKRVFIPKSP